jgi:hypothetical protein
MHLCPSPTNYIRDIALAELFDFDLCNMGYLVFTATTPNKGKTSAFT